MEYIKGPARVMVVESDPTGSTHMMRAMAFRSLPEMVEHFLTKQAIGGYCGTQEHYRTLLDLQEKLRKTIDRLTAELASTELALSEDSNE